MESYEDYEKEQARLFKQGTRREFEEEHADDKEFDEHYKNELMED